MNTSLLSKRDETPSKIVGIAGWFFLRIWFGYVFIWGSLVYNVQEIFGRNHGKWQRCMIYLLNMVIF